jgi:hypothetical protein
MEYNFYIAIQNDSSIFDTVCGALESLGLNFTVKLNLVTNVSEDFDPTSGITNENIETVLAAKSELVKVFTFSLRNQMTVSINRNHSDKDGNYTGTLCALKHSGERQAAAIEFQSVEWLKLIQDLRTNLVAVDSRAYTDAILGPEISEHYKRRDEELEKLYSMVATATENLAKHQREVDKTIAANEKRYREEQAKRDGEKDNEVAALKAQLNDKQAALQERESQLDDRQNVHVRRELRGQWHERIEKRFTDFKLTADTQKMREPVTRAVFGGLVLSSFLVIASIASIGVGAYTQNTNWFYLSLVKGAIGGVAFFSLLSYYLHWQNGWLEKHAKAEFNHLQMALDIDRASWVVEMALEWNKEGNQPVPEDLLARLTRNMFATDGDGDPKQRKSDDFLLTLLGASSKFEVDVAGNKVTLNRRGCKEIVKEVGGTEEA